jgi:predicted methyltransferase
MVRRSRWYLVGLASLSIHAIAGSTVAGEVVSATVRSALADPRRPTEQMALDATRRPDVMVEFSAVKPGDRVTDFMPGNAYFTRILSDVVGPRGHVYAFSPSEQIANCPAREIAGTLSLAKDRSYGNVTVLRRSLTVFRLPEKLDMIWTAQNYHDFHDKFLGPPDVAVLNRAFFNALKPGGIFLVIDHVAEAGSGLRDTESLHRIDPVRLRSEIEAAGFVFEASSAALRNSNDDHTRTVFDPSIRGKTDQIVFRFRKPL